jgi:hypothetical protein
MSKSAVSFLSFFRNHWHLVHGSPKPHEMPEKMPIVGNAIVSDIETLA